MTPEKTSWYTETIKDKPYPETTPKLKISLNKKQQKIVDDLYSFIKWDKTKTTPYEQIPYVRDILKKIKQIGEIKDHKIMMAIIMNLENLNNIMKTLKYTENERNRVTSEIKSFSFYYLTQKEAKQMFSYTLKNY